MKIQANIESRNSALVSPRLAGVLEEIIVREGDEVLAGRTPLFRTDSLNLEKAVEMARLDLVIKKCAREEKEAYLEQILVELGKAKIDFVRYRQLFQNHNVSRDSFEGRRTAFARLQAIRKHAESSLVLAREEEHQKAAALAIAEKNLKDAVVMAPISVRISQRKAEPGEMGSPGVPVVRIDDVRNLECSGFLPGYYYERIRSGGTRVRISSGEHDWGEYTINYKSPTVDPTLRTFEIKCLVQGDGERFIPGALVDLRLVLASREGLGVPTRAIRQYASAQVVFTADSNLAHLVEVETGLETAVLRKSRRTAFPPATGWWWRASSCWMRGRPSRSWTEAGNVSIQCRRPSSGGYLLPDNRPVSPGGQCLPPNEPGIASPDGCPLYHGGDGLPRRLSPGY